MHIFTLHDARSDHHEACLIAVKPDAAHPAVLHSGCVVDLIDLLVAHFSQTFPCDLKRDEVEDFPTTGIFHVSKYRPIVAFESLTIMLRERGDHDGSPSGFIEHPTAIHHSDTPRTAVRNNLPGSRFG